MITIMLIAYLIARIVIKKSKEAPASGAMLCLFVGTLCAAVFALNSVNSLPEGFESVPVYAVATEEVAPLYVYDGELYRCNRLGMAWLIPGAPFDYEKYEGEYRLCSDCNVAISTPHCGLCGTSLE